MKIPKLCIETIVRRTSSFITGVRLSCQSGLCLITLASEWKPRRRTGLREGRTDGGQVVGTDTCAQGTHKPTDSHTQTGSAIRPAHGISILFMTVLYLWFSTPFVCVWACLGLRLGWSLGISVQAATLDAGISCGKPSDGQSKGKSPHDNCPMLLLIIKFR